jgi:hypothetical protein
MGKKWLWIRGEFARRGINRSFRSGDEIGRGEIGISPI